MIFKQPLHTTAMSGRTGDLIFSDKHHSLWLDSGRRSRRLISSSLCSFSLSSYQYAPHWHTVLQLNGYLCYFSVSWSELCSTRVARSCHHAIFGSLCSLHLDRTISWGINGYRAALMCILYIYLNLSFIKMCSFIKKIDISLKSVKRTTQMCYVKLISPSSSFCSLRTIKEDFWLAVDGSLHFALHCALLNKPESVCSWINRWIIPLTWMFANESKFPLSKTFFFFFRLTDWKNA